jgi:hypothetical protein
MHSRQPYGIRSKAFKTLHTALNTPVASRFRGGGAGGGHLAGAAPSGASLLRAHPRSEWAPLPHATPMLMAMAVLLQVPVLRQ